MAEATGGAVRRCAVLLVRGDGCEASGRVLDEASRAAAARDPRLMVESLGQTQFLREPTSQEEDPAQTRPEERRSFVFPVRRAARQDRQMIIFAEIASPDIGQAEDGDTPTALRAILGVLTGHQILEAVFEGARTASSQATRRLAMTASAIVRGPIPAMALCLLAVFCAMQSITYLGDPLGLSTAAAPFRATMIGLAWTFALGLVLLSGRFGKHVLYRDIGWSAAAIALIGLVIAVGSLAGRPAYVFDAEAFFAGGWLALIGLWAVVAALLLLGFLVYLAAALPAVLRISRRESRSRLLALCLTAMQAAVWAALTALPWLAVSSAAGDMVDRGSPYLSGPALMEGLAWSAMLGVAAISVYFAATALSFVCRSVFLACMPSIILSRVRPPRIAFSPLAVHAALLTIALGAAVFLLGLLDALGLGLVEAGALGPVSAAFTLESLQIAVAIAAVALPIAAAATHATLRDVGRLLITMVAQLGDAPEARARRARIAARFDAVFDHMVQRERVTAVVIVAEGAASISAFDQVKRLAPRCARLGVGLQVLTLGAPLRASYAHYLGAYHGLEDDVAEMAESVTRWAGFYRLDDPAAGPMAASHPARVENVALPPERFGEPRSYWSEPAVVDALIMATKTVDPSQADRGRVAVATPEQDDIVMFPRRRDGQSTARETEPEVPFGVHRLEERTPPSARANPDEVMAAVARLRSTKRR